MDDRRIKVNDQRIKVDGRRIKVDDRTTEKVDEWKMKVDNQRIKVNNRKKKLNNWKNKGVGQLYRREGLCTETPEPISLRNTFSVLSGHVALTVCYSCISNCVLHEL